MMMVGSQSMRPHNSCLLDIVQLVGATRLVAEYAVYGVEDGFVLLSVQESSDY